MSNVFRTRTLYSMCAQIFMSLFMLVSRRRFLTSSLQIERAALCHPAPFDNENVVFLYSFSFPFISSISQDGLVINHHADHTLNSFCHWQSTLGGREGRHHDHAILLTGLDICSWKNEPCDTLGTASSFSPQH